MGPVEQWLSDEDAAIRALRADVYLTRSKKERSLMARGIYAAAASEGPKRRD